MNGHGDGPPEKEEKDDEDIETDEAKKIVEALTGSDSQTCKLALKLFILDKIMH